MSEGKSLRNTKQPKLAPAKKSRKALVVEISASTNKPWYEKFRIPVEIINESHVGHVNDAKARSIFAISAPQEIDLGGVMFHYINRETGKPQYFRVRRDKGEETRVITKNGKKKKVKYGKYIGNGSKTHDRILYGFEGSFERLTNKRTTILLVEAEKSVLAIEAWCRRTGRQDIVPLAMGGCQGWKDKEHGVLPDMDVCNGRDVIILLDANIHTNKLVSNAEIQLVAWLRSRKCRVKTATMSQIEGINGPDDLLTRPDGDDLLTSVLGEAEDTTVAPYSEHALAERFALDYQDDACYVHGLGWHVWTGKRWKRDTSHAVEKHCQQLCSTAASERSSLPEQNKLRSRNAREAVMREAQAHMVVSIDDLDKDPMLLNTPNGVVDLRNGTVRPVERSDYCTKITSVAPIKKKPVRWLAFIREITLGDKKLERYLQRLAGQCLTGDTSEQEFYFFYGDGMNGKGEFMYAQMTILGDYAAVAPMEAFVATHNQQHSTSIAALVGARLVTASEVEDGHRWAESRLKELTGGTPITARFMRQDGFTFMPQFKLVLAGNVKPRLRDTGTSMQRRLMIVPFLLKLAAGKRDRALRGKLHEEHGAILQWAIDGCVEWQRTRMQPPQAVLNASSQYFEQQDVMGTWLNEQVEVNMQAKESSKVLYADYKSWCESSGEVFVLNHREFSQKLTDRNFTRKHTRDGACFFGLRLRKRSKFGGNGE